MMCRSVHRVQAFTVCLLVLLSATFAAAVEPPQETLVDERQVDQYLFQVFQGEKDKYGFSWQQLVVSRDGQPLFEAENRFVFFQEDFVQGLAVDGGEKRFAVVGTHSGGNHCCLRLLLFHLEHPFHLYASILMGEGDSWDPLRSDGKDVLMDYPWPWFGYFYWHLVYPPWGDVIPLIVRPGNLTPVPGRLTREPWSEEECGKRLAHSAEQVLKGEGFPKPGAGYIDRQTHLPEDLPIELLSYAQSGHADLARQLLERVWPGDTQSREEYWNGFVERLRASPLWDQLCDVNGWPGRGEGTFQRDHLLFPPNRWATE